MDYLNRVSISTWAAVTGLCGSVLGLFVHAEINTLRQRIAYVFGGVCCSTIFPRPVADWLQLADDKQLIWLPAFGFILGLFGMALLQRLKHTVDNLDVGAVLAARFRDILAAIRGQK